MEPFFSIIIPTLNEENFLPNLLTDLKKQKEKNFEVIIVDGGSVDKTDQVAKQYGAFLPISFFRNEKKNVSFQRNFGARQAKGKYLIFLDADTRIATSFTKKCFKTITKENGLLFIPYFDPENENLQIEIIFRLTNYIAEYSHNIGKPFSLGGNMILEKNFFHLIGGFPEDVFISEDHALVQKAHDWGVRAKFLRNVKTKFNLRRIKREGVRLWYKNLVAIGHILLKRKMDKKIFEYEMGGHLYSAVDKKETPEELLQKYLKKAKIFFNKLF